MPPRPLLAIFLLLGAASCHKAPKPVGGLNPDDAAALNNAADLLDTSADDLSAPPNGTVNTGDDVDDGSAGGGNGG